MSEPTQVTVTGPSAPVTVKVGADREVTQFTPVASDPARQVTVRPTGAPATFTTTSTAPLAGGVHVTPNTSAPGKTGPPGPQGASLRELFVEPEPLVNFPGNPYLRFELDEDGELLRIWLGTEAEA